MSKPIEIFKPGKHTAMSGVALNFTESDVLAMVAAYDPAKYEAPLVIGHPKTDDPAYGWVKGLSFADGLVAAEPHQVEDSFAELVNAGRYKKISASFYTPDAPNNPVPGVYYLRHVGFLGAQPPAVKGLKSASFSDAEQGVIEFADWDKLTIANLFRRLREYIIGKDGVDAANQHLPEYEINSLQINAAQDDDDGGMKPYFAEPKGEDMSEQDKQRLAALEAENTALKADAAKHEAEKAAFAEVKEKQKLDVMHQENTQFAEGLVKQGKLLPANKEATIALLDKLSADETKIDFGEGDDKKSQTPLALYKSQLEAAPKLVDFGEHSGGQQDAKATKFNAPAGFSVDESALETHEKAVAYAEANAVSYEIALTKVV